jgi:hypothetical protein
MFINLNFDYLVDFIVFSDNSWTYLVFLLVFLFVGCSILVSIIFCIVFYLYSKEKMQIFFEESLYIVQYKEFDSNVLNFFHKILKYFFLFLILVPNFIFFDLLFYFHIVGFIYYFCTIFVFLYSQNVFLLFLYIYSMILLFIAYLVATTYSYSNIYVKECFVQIFLSKKNLDKSDSVILKFMGNPTTALIKTAQYITFGIASVGVVSFANNMENSMLEKTIHNRVKLQLEYHDKHGMKLSPEELKGIIDGHADNVHKNNNGIMKEASDIAKKVLGKEK